MKLKNKLLSLALATLFLATPLLSCGKGGSDTGRGPAGDDSALFSETDRPEIPDDLYFDDHPTIRFIVTGGDSNSGEELPYRSVTVDEDADMGYAVNKMVNDRNRKVEEALGVKIELTQKVDMAHLAETIKPVLASGSDDYDVISGFQYYDIGIPLDDATAGSFLNYNRIPEENMYIDIQKPYWDEALYEQLSLGGAACWVTGDLSQAWVGSIYVSFVNKRIWSSYADEIRALAGSSDIYEVVDSGKWTMDLLSELSKAVYIDSNANEKVDEEDQVGFMTYKPNLGAIMSDGLAGGAHVTYTKWVDGVPQVDFVNPHNTEFSKKLNTLVRESNALVIDGAVAEKYILTTWANGRSLFTVNLLSNTEIYLSDMDDDYYIVPVPKLDENQKEYTTVTHDSVSLYGIPRSCQYVGAVTATLELMAYYSYKLVTPAYYDAALKERYTRDPKTGEMIDRIRDSLYSDFVMLWSAECGEITHFFRTNINKRFTSEANSKLKGWQAGLGDLLDRIESSAFLEE